MAASSRPRRPARPKLVADNTQPVSIARVLEDMRLTSAARGRRPADIDDPFALRPPPAWLPRDMAPIAQDEAIPSYLAWASSSVVGSIEEGQTFLGYAYLAELAQRPEYRLIAGVLAEEATREWIELKSASAQKGRQVDDDKTAKLRELEDALVHFGVRDAFKRSSMHDGLYGRGHLYLGLCDPDNRDEVATPIGDGRGALSKVKIRRGSLKYLRNVEPIWVYPTNYESTNPLKQGWYRPDHWMVMDKRVHRSRLLTFVAREVPDILKPVYQFGGLSLTQMVKPYVDIWLRTRQSIADLIHSRIVWVLLTKLDVLTQPGGRRARDRAELFNLLRDNNNLMMLDKDTEEFKNVEGSLAGLHELQSQAQEHMCSISQTPVVKLLGVQPEGMNASSEGELKAWEDRVRAYQESFFRPNLTVVVDVVQCHLWGEVDPDITFQFKRLRQLTDKEIAELQKILADTAAVDIEYGAIDPEERREAIAGDPDTQYAGLDLSGPAPGFQDEPGKELGQGQEPFEAGSFGPSETPTGTPLPGIRGANPGREDQSGKILRRALGGARSIGAMDIVYDAMTPPENSFNRQYRVAFVHDPSIPSDIADPKVRVAASVFDYLRDRFGLDPARDAGLRRIELCPADKVEGCAGDYEAGTIGVADDLGPGVGPLYPGMRKVSAGDDEGPLDYASVLRHEVGHAWQRAFERRSGLALAREFALAWPTTVTDLSEYSAVDPVEWFAESFGAYTHPKFAGSGVRLHPPLLAAFERLIPRRAGAVDAAKLAHAAVAFEHPARGPHRCAECRHYRGRDDCELVAPPIAPGDWCDRFEDR